ncbi:MAG: thioredoxin [Nanobdellota archaeon]
MTVVHLNKENFDKEVKQSDLPVIVDFWADWCGPCKIMGPVFEEASKDYEGKLKFAKVNTEENQQLAADNGVMSIPTMVIYKKGEEADRIVGAMSKDDFKKEIDKRLE